MKKGFIKFLTIGIISLCLFSFAGGQTKKRKERIVEPTVKEAIKQVFLNGDISLSAAKHCRGVGTSFDDKTVLDFLSGILSFQATPESSNRIEFVFRRERGKNGELVWACDLQFNGSDKEDVWSNGVRFKMRDADRKLMRESLTCIGSG